MTIDQPSSRLSIDPRLNNGIQLSAILVYKIFPDVAVMLCTNLFYLPSELGGYTVFTFVRQSVCLSACAHLVPSV